MNGGTWTRTPALTVPCCMCAEGWNGLSYRFLALGRGVIGAPPEGSSYSRGTRSCSDENRSEWSAALWPARPKRPAMAEWDNQKVCKRRDMRDRHGVYPITRGWPAPRVCALRRLHLSPNLKACSSLKHRRRYLSQHGRHVARHVAVGKVDAAAPSQRGVPCSKRTERRSWTISRFDIRCAHAPRSAILCVMSI